MIRKLVSTVSRILQCCTQCTRCKFTSHSKVFFFAGWFEHCVSLFLSLSLSNTSSRLNKKINQMNIQIKQQQQQNITKVSTTTHHGTNKITRYQQATHAIFLSVLSRHVVAESCWYITFAMPFQKLLCNRRSLLKTHGCSALPVPAVVVIIRLLLCWVHLQSDYDYDAYAYTYVYCTTYTRRRLLSSAQCAQFHVLLVR